MSKARVIGAAVIALAAPLVMFSEGLVLNPTPDPIGIVSVCYGETHADMTRTYTPAECREMLQASLEKHGADLLACVPPDLPKTVLAASLSFAYNVGGSRFCASTYASRLRVYDRRACAELDRWVYAGGQKLPGLVTRRKNERALCERWGDA